MNWLKRLFGVGSPESETATSQPAPPTVEEMNRVMPAYGQLMEKHAAFVGAVFDETMLPVPKARLEFIIFCAIGVPEDEHQAQQVAAGLLQLADYQPNVGPEPVTQLPSLPHPASLTTPEAIRAAAEAVSAHGRASRYSEFEARVKHDLDRLKGLADKALAVRAARAKRGIG